MYRVEVLDMGVLTFEQGLIQGEAQGILFIGQQLLVFPKTDNTHNRRAPVVYKDDSIVGHVS